MTAPNTTQSLKRYKLNKTLRLERELGRGGEGTIHAIVGMPHLVAKIYHKPSTEKTDKLLAMLANPPNSQRNYNEKNFRGKHIYIAWPTALIVNEKDECVGFTMPYINMDGYFPLFKVYNPRDRRELKIYDKKLGRIVSVNFSWYYLLRMAYNLSHIVSELHEANYVIGDLNESNLLVTREALLTLVDCDSIQVPKPGKTTFFRSPVGKPEYTPPELQGKDFSLVDRKQKHDNFGLAVLIFLLLMEGRHPFSGAWQGEGSPRTLAENIQAYDFPYGPSNSSNSRLKPPKNALSFKILPQTIQELMLKSFARPRSATEIVNRPSAREWTQALEVEKSQLVSCPRTESLHVYNKKLAACPWCERMERGIPDPFPWHPHYPGETPPATTFEVVVPKPKKPPTVTGTVHAVAPSLKVFGLALLCFAFFLCELYVANLIKTTIFHAGPLVVILVLFLILALPFILFSRFIRKFL